MALLEGKKVLVTGVLTEGSIAFHVARLAQLEGAEVVLSSFGRQAKLTAAIARRLPTEAPVVQLDVTDDADLAALAGRVAEHVDHLDGVVHSIGFAPQSVHGRRTSWPASGTTSRRRCTSRRTPSRRSRWRRSPMLRPGASIVGLTFDASLRLAGLRLDGRGQGRVRVDRSVPGP